MSERKVACIEEQPVDFGKVLQPRILNAAMQTYQRYFGPEFGVKEMLQIYDILAKTQIAEAIREMPAVLPEQKTKESETR